MSHAPQRAWLQLLPPTQRAFPAWENARKGDARSARQKKGAAAAAPKAIKLNFRPAVDQLAGCEAERVVAISCIARLTDVLKISTFVPTGTTSNTRTTSRDRMRMQP